MNFFPWSVLRDSTPTSLFDLDLFFNLSPTTNSSDEDGETGDFIVETGTPHPDWLPGDPQPHPYLDLNEGGGEGKVSASASAPASASENDANGADDGGEKRRERIREALLAAPRHFVDPSRTPGSALYPLTISAVVPRPIALVSTLSPVDEKNPERFGNLSPFSYCGLVAHDPPHVAIGTCATSGKPDRAKDTQYNILETKEFVVNLISDWYVEAANHTCGFFDRGVDEMELAGLTPQESVRVAPPRVAEAAVQLECRLVASFPVHSRSAPPAAAAAAAAAASTSSSSPSPGEEEAAPPQTTMILIGEVVALHVLEAVSSPTADGRSITVDPRKLRPVCRLGGDTYGTLGRLFDLPRPGKEWQERREATRAAAK